MYTEDRDVSRTANVAKQHLVFGPFAVAAAAAGRLLARLKPGYDFEVVGVQVYAEGVGAQDASVDVLIGDTSVLQDDVVLVAADAGDPPLAGDLSSTAADLLGRSTDTLSVATTTEARVIGAAVAGANTGNGVPGAVTGGSALQAGIYVLTCITAAANAGTFRVLTPDGVRLKDLTVAVAYASAHINLTLADGAADFIVGDSFTVTVTEGGTLSGLTVTVTIRPQGLRS